MDAIEAAQVIISVSCFQGFQTGVDLAVTVRKEELLQTSQSLEGFAAGHRAGEGHSEADTIGVHELSGGSGVDDLVDARAAKVRAEPDPAVLDLLASRVVQLDANKPG